MHKRQFVTEIAIIAGEEDFIMSDLRSRMLDGAKERIRARYGENRQITDTNYDKSLAVRCVNGTFVGRREGNIISYMTIPASVYPSWFCGYCSSVS